MLKGRRPHWPSQHLFFPSNASWLSPGRSTHWPSQRRFGTTWRKPRGVGRKKMTKSTPAFWRKWGRLVTTTFTGPLGARSRLTWALSVAAPISSTRIGRNQYVAYSEHSVSGVDIDSARRISEHRILRQFLCQSNGEIPSYNLKDVIDSVKASP